MAASDHFVKWYASVTDDVRHHVVERGWYGRELSGNEMRQDVDRTIAAHEPSQSIWDHPSHGDPASSEGGFYGNTHVPGAESHDLYGDADGQTETSDLYGYDATQRAEMDEFYGSEERPEPSPEDLYGEPSAPSDAEAFYGYTPENEPEAADFYGEPEQDLEQEL